MLLGPTLFTIWRNCFDCCVFEKKFEENGINSYAMYLI